MKKGMYTYIIIYKLLAFGVVLTHQTSRLMKPKTLLFAVFFAALIYSVYAQAGKTAARTPLTGSKLTINRGSIAINIPVTTTTVGSGASQLYQKYNCS